MLRLKTIGEQKNDRGAEDRQSRGGNGSFGGGLADGGCGAGTGAGNGGGTGDADPEVPIAGSKIGPAAPVTYDNKYEIFAGFNFMNFQAGQNLPKRMNLGGGEVWVHLLAARRAWLEPGMRRTIAFEAGTTPVFAEWRNTRSTTIGDRHQQPAAGVYEYGDGGRAVSRPEEPVCCGELSTAMSVCRMEPSATASGMSI